MASGKNNIPANASLVEKLQWLQTNAKSDEEYNLAVTKDENISAQTLSFPEKSKITVRLTGSGGEKVVSLIGEGSLFKVESGVTLILEDGITLLGHSKNNASLVYVTEGGTLIMNNGAKIIGNTAENTDGGGVYVKGSFEMTGGEISGNTGSIGASSFGCGGGVFVSEWACFKMGGGKISDNTSNGCGGGVRVNANATFEMTDGVISGNTARNAGGGLHVVKPGIFFKTGGVVYGITGNNNSNRAMKAEKSHAVFVTHGMGMCRENTAGPDVELDSRKTGVDGGWEFQEGWCYIATAVYRSYDAPEVLCLRRFRDEILSTYILGRLFIKLYYLFSPPIAERLKKAWRVNTLVRRALDIFVGRLHKMFHNQNGVQK
jgi:hypothetical protein